MLVFSTAEKRVPELNDVFSESSRPHTFINIPFGVGDLSVVEESSAEKRSHPCAKPKRFTGSRGAVVVEPQRRGLCKVKVLKPTRGRTKGSGAMWGRCWRCWLLPLTLTRALGNVDKGFLAILVTKSPPLICLRCWYGSFGRTRYGETAT